MAASFVAQLPIISRADLVYGDKCAICHEAYGTNVTCSGTVSDDAVRLPFCGHEFGKICLEIWLSPKEGKNSCPLCRDQLFPAESPVEEAFVPLHGLHDVIMEADWDDMATEVNSELSAHGIVHRSRPFRDWLLYSQLQHQGASLPPWRPSATNPGPRLDDSQEEALFVELRRRGAFRVLPVPVGLLVSERETWTFLRDYGYFYDPIYAATSAGCAWSQTT
ncbi:hypothetical protein IMSHALPRED_006881 [Imshaugia aleurites]|uniref:RING-type domain-containing protein n=1 Tax=Imshaugia aleurites TaxID=172621 RepID=A0A8H3FQT1_9LECA|nr:hypothetical protein IMSHALPRED_006881 [Imshaugia aleurites]